MIATSNFGSLDGHGYSLGKSGKILLFAALKIVSHGYVVGESGDRIETLLLLHHPNGGDINFTLMGILLV